jgi:hypothetical protein
LIVSIRSKILASACVLAVSAFAAPAFAAGFDGVFSGDYSHLDANSGGGSANSWGASGGGLFGINPNWAVQVDGGYHNISASGGGGSTNIWNVDGSVQWRGMWGRLGAVVGYNSSDAGGGGGNLDVTNYGGFVDWYAGKAITATLKAGGFTANAGLDGSYAGVGITGYVMPDLALSATYDYTRLNGFGNENDYGVQAEWLVSETTPISIYAGYTNSKISGGGPTINIYGGGIKWYVDQAGPMTLVDRQRSGESSGAAFGPTLLKF